MDELLIYGIEAADARSPGWYDGGLSPLRNAGGGRGWDSISSGCRWVFYS